jgi:DNA-binding LytR/AlgR family response regulator
VFLLVFQPFGLSELHAGIVRISLGYGLCTFFVMLFLNSIVMPFFPRFFNEERWTVQRELYWNMMNVTLIGLVNALYSSYIGITAFTPYAVLIFELYTITIAVFPISIFVFFKEAGLKKEYENKSKEINLRLEKLGHGKAGLRAETDVNPTIPGADSKEAGTGPNDRTLVFVSENEKERLEVEISDLIFIQSADNYVEIHYQQGHTFEKKLLRTTLKTIANDLSAHGELFRCHKSYLVNLKRVSHVSGNAQGYKLHLSGTSLLIPVSRQNNTLLKKKLSL